MWSGTVVQNQTKTKGSGGNRGRKRGGKTFTGYNNQSSSYNGNNKPKNLDEYYHSLLNPSSSSKPSYATPGEKTELKEVINNRFSVLGIDIDFPFPPYGIQKAMMNKMVLALSNKQHCLIESPTGTGKTLVLLCSVLAWQKKSKELLHPFVSKKYQDKLRSNRTEKKGSLSKPCTCGRRPTKCKTIDENDEPEIDESCAKKAKLTESPYFSKANSKQDHYVINLDDDDECKIVEASTSKLAEEELGEGCIKQEMCTTCLAFEAEKTYLELCGDDSQDGFTTATGERTGVDLEVRKVKIPRIYYGTRTHKQIAQVIREVNKTDYRSKLNMTILSSRDRTCINSEVRDLATRNDKCRELNRNKRDEKSLKPTCRFHKDSQETELAFMSLQDHFDDRAFDIEDAATFGNEHCVCPFYGLRAIQSKVDITFCPYNYILDPTIRQAMNINLKNSIIILDEAHNIEDTCRESASFSVNTKQIEEIIECIKIAVNQGEPAAAGIYDSLHFFKNLLSQIQLWMSRQQFEESFQSNGANWSNSLTFEDAYMESALESIDLGKSNLEKLKSHLVTIKGNEEGEEAKEQNKQTRDHPALNMNQMQIIGKMVLAMDYMYSNDELYSTSYKLVLTRSLEAQQPFNKTKEVATQGNGPKVVYELSLFCMSPAVAFGKVRDLAWSIIVASGTLSPLESLKTELGTQFECVFEGMHVIRQEQIFATIVDKGPGGIDLNCSFERSQTLSFQDEVGQIVVDVCKKVPNGVLCFFASYDRMDKLCARWAQKGYLTDITRKYGKNIYRESKDLSTEEFEHHLQEYNREAQESGALLLGVFRGKVSEGIDFADRAARAVITIGIPFPSIKDVQVTLKKKYNDEVRKSQPNIMTGNNWYTSQGFRALNQALGRCIRHQNDWGAILMIDSRLKWDSYKVNLSRWIRQLAYICGSYQQVSSGLESFIASRSAASTEVLTLS